MRAIPVSLSTRCAAMLLFVAPAHAQSVLGTPAAIVWQAGTANPVAQNLTVETGAECAVLTWTYWRTASTGAGLLSATLDSAAPDQTFEFAISGNNPGVGVVLWEAPTTGTVSVDVEWDAQPGQGPTSYLISIDDCNQMGFVDVDGSATGGSTANTVTLTGLTAGDLVMKHDMRGSGTTEPANTSGWTSLATQINASEASRLASIVAAGASQECPSEDESFSGVVCFALAGAGGGGGTMVNPISGRGGAAAQPVIN